MDCSNFIFVFLAAAACCCAEISRIKRQTEEGDEEQKWRHHAICMFEGKRGTNGLGAVGLLNICQRGTSDPVLRISGDLQVGKTVEEEVDLGQLEIALSARAGKDCTDTGGAFDPEFPAHPRPDSGDLGSAPVDPEDGRATVDILTQKVLLVGRSIPLAGHPLVLRHRDSDDRIGCCVIQWKVPQNFYCC